MLLLKYYTLFFKKENTIHLNLLNTTKIKKGLNRFMDNGPYIYIGCLDFRL